MTLRRARKKTWAVLFGLCLLAQPALQAAKAIEAPSSPVIFLCDQTPANDVLCDCCGAGADVGADSADNGICQGFCSTAWVLPAAPAVGRAPRACTRTPRPPGYRGTAGVAQPEPDPPKRSAPV